MRWYTAVVFLAAAISLGLKDTGPPKSKGLLDKYAKLASKVESVHVVVTLRVTEDGALEMSGAGDLWAESKTGRYASRFRITVMDKDWTSTHAEHAIHTDEGTVAWETTDGKLQHVEKRVRAEKAKLPQYVKDLNPLCFIYDGLCGYKALAEGVELKRDAAPAGGNDRLDWFAVQKQEEGQETEFYDEMDLEVVTLWLGFSPKDGLIHSLVFRQDDGKDGDNMLGVMEITDIDLNPDLEGVFAPPADVAAELATKPEQQIPQAK